MKRHDLGLLILRLAIGLGLFWGHGLDKLLNFSQRAGTFPDPLGITSQVSLALMIVAEVPCALAVASGFLTRLAAIPPILGMLVAIFAIEVGEPFGEWELALLYLAGYATVALLGPGRLSLDHRIRGKA